MAWFNFLKAEGYFNPENNPTPIKLGDTFQLPYWEPLNYLEKLSIQISEGEESELIDDLLAVIVNVSKNPKDNYKTWYVFIKILSNLPNERIHQDLFKFLPIWFSGQFDTMLQTTELCERLLPKFLNQAPTDDDIFKAELILNFLFKVERSTELPAEIVDGEGDSYKTRIYHSFLSDRLNKNDLIPKIAKYCSNHILIKLAQTIKSLLLDYPNGIQNRLTDESGEHEVKIVVTERDLIVSSKSIDKKREHLPQIISDYASLNDQQLRDSLIAALKKNNLNYIPSDNENDIYKRLIFSLTNDLLSTFGLTDIKKLDDRYRQREKVVNVFALIFRDLLSEKVNHDPEDGIALLHEFTMNVQYKIPFFKRIALYVIGEHWHSVKSVFWKLLGNNDSYLLFSDYKYENELIDLLNDHQQEFTNSEKEILETIIENGEQGKKEKSNRPTDYWKLKWYAQIRKTAPFSEKYSLLAKTLNVSEGHFKRRGDMHWRSGSISPFSNDELLQKTDREIVDFIKSFKPTDRWEEPTIEGLSETLGGVVEANPERFSIEIDAYHEIGYIYLYRIINAFTEAWKKGKPFDWARVLNFCDLLLQNEKFNSGSLTLETDTWHAKQDWVIGSIAQLLTAGLQNDEKAFDLSLLPVSKKIIQLMSTDLEDERDFEKSNMDFIMYSMNSTSGKVLRASLDYSLRRARNLPKESLEEKWEFDIRSLFNKAIQDHLIDGYTLQGMYFQQFYFLDNEWIIRHAKEYYSLEEKQWQAFMSGIIYGGPPSNEKVYFTFLPHYERLIENGNHLQHDRYSGGLENHLTAFYFWGFETLESKRLLFKFLNNSSHADIQTLIHFVSRQANYGSTLEFEKRKEFEKIIVDLWQYLTEKYENSSESESIKTLASLAELTVFVPELDELFTKLILKSSGYVHQIHSSHELLEQLTILKSKGTPVSTAKYIGAILSSMTLDEYFSGEDREFIKELVEFLYMNGDVHTATSICNKIASEHQLFFLRNIYDKYAK